MLNGIALGLNFAWREFAITSLNFFSLSFFILSCHFLAVSATFVGFFFVYQRTIPDLSLVQNYLEKVSSNLGIQLIFSDTFVL